MALQTVRSPLSHPIAIDDLRPTQMTVGVREIEQRAVEIKKMAKDKAIQKNVIPVVKGPKDHLYVIDHHHLCRALLLAGVDEVSVIIVLNLDRLEKDEFWVFMDNRGLVHPFDAGGKRQSYSDIPKKLKDLEDDPFRSLAGELRRMGGYAKDTTPFSEFLWADYLRRRIDPADVKKDFDAALGEAMALAKKRQSDHLPGWCGPVEAAA